MYDVKFSTQAAKFFKKLPFDIQNRIKDKFKEISLVDNPSASLSIMKETTIN